MKQLIREHLDDRLKKLIIQYLNKRYQVKKELIMFHIVDSNGVQQDAIKIVKDIEGSFDVDTNDAVEAYDAWYYNERSKLKVESKENLVREHLDPDLQARIKQFLTDNFTVIPTPKISYGSWAVVEKSSDLMVSVDYLLKKVAQEFNIKSADGIPAYQSWYPEAVERHRQANRLTPKMEEIIKKILKSYEYLTVREGKDELQFIDPNGVIMSSGYLAHMIFNTIGLPLTREGLIDAMKIIHRWGEDRLR